MDYPKSQSAEDGIIWVIWKSGETKITVIWIIPRSRVLKNANDSDKSDKKPNPQRDEAVWILSSGWIPSHRKLGLSPFLDAGCFKTFGSVEELNGLLAEAYESLYMSFKSLQPAASNNFKNSAVFEIKLVHTDS